MRARARTSAITLRKALRPRLLAAAPRRTFLFGDRCCTEGEEAQKQEHQDNLELTAKQNRLREQMEMLRSEVASLRTALNESKSEGGRVGTLNVPQPLEVTIPKGVKVDVPNLRAALGVGLGVGINQQNSGPVKVDISERVKVDVALKGGQPLSIRSIEEPITANVNVSGLPHQPINVQLKHSHHDAPLAVELKAIQGQSFNIELGKMSAEATAQLVDVLKTLRLEAGANGSTSSSGGVVAEGWKRLWQVAGLIAAAYLAEQVLNRASKTAPVEEPDTFWLRTYWRDLKAGRTTGGYSDKAYVQADKKALEGLTLSRANLDAETKKAVQEALGKLSGNNKSLELLRIALAFRARAAALVDNTKADDMPMPNEVKVLPGSFWTWLNPWARRWDPADEAVTRQLDVATAKYWQHYDHRANKSGSRLPWASLFPKTVPCGGLLGADCVLMSDVNRVFVMRLAMTAGTAASEYARLNGKAEDCTAACREQLGRIKSVADSYGQYRKYTGCPSGSILSGSEVANHVRVLMAGAVPAGASADFKALLEHLEKN